MSEKNYLIEMFHTDDAPENRVMLALAAGRIIRGFFAQELPSTAELTQHPNWEMSLETVEGTLTVRHNLVSSDNDLQSLKDKLFAEKDPTVNDKELLGMIGFLDGMRKSNNDHDGIELDGERDYFDLSTFARDNKLKARFFGVSTFDFPYNIRYINKRPNPEFVDLKKPYSIEILRTQLRQSLLELTADKMPNLGQYLKLPVKTVR